jgi:SAM-dependent methyltransferase
MSATTPTEIAPTEIAPEPPPGRGSLYGRLFARMYDRATKQLEREGGAELRRELLISARGRTLELGAGTGLNLEHYPTTIEELVLTDPDPHMLTQLRRRVARDGRQAQLVQAAAERLPFPDKLRHGRIDLGALHRRRPRPLARRDPARAQARRTPPLPRARPLRRKRTNRTLARPRDPVRAQGDLRLPPKPQNPRHDRSRQPPDRDRPTRNPTQRQPPLGKANDRRHRHQGSISATAG